MAHSEITAVHQVLPSLHVADASGSHTLCAREALREEGFASELFVEHVDPPLAGEVRAFEEIDAFAPAGKTVILYQLAVGSVLAERIMRRPEPIFVNYHNLTPADFFWKWAPDWLNAVDSGRQQLHRLAPRVSHAIAVSEFNRQDLLSAGYRSTSVVPPFVAFDTRGPHPLGEHRLSYDEGHVEGHDGRAGARGRGARWLFVGKLLPHKAAHDLVKALFAYRKAYDSAATLCVAPS